MTRTTRTSVRAVSFDSVVNPASVRSTATPAPFRSRCRADGRSARPLPAAWNGHMRASGARCQAGVLPGEAADQGRVLLVVRVLEERGDAAAAGVGVGAG